MANEFTRIAHAASGGSSTVDINSSKSTTGDIPGRLILGCGDMSPASYIPVSGYTHLSLNPPSAGNYVVAAYWAYADGTESQTLGNLTNGTWTDFTVPENAICVKLTVYYSSTSFVMVYYSLTN